MERAPLKQIGCGYLQSYYLLCIFKINVEDGRFIKTGYYMDSLTSIRVINLHRLAPSLIPLVQSVPFFRGTLAFKGGDDRPITFNTESQVF